MKEIVSNLNMQIVSRKVKICSHAVKIKKETTRSGNKEKNPNQHRKNG